MKKDKESYMTIIEPYDGKAPKTEDLKDFVAKTVGSIISSEDYDKLN